MCWNVVIYMLPHIYYVYLPQACAAKHALISDLVHYRLENKQLALQTVGVGLDIWV